MTWLLAVQVYIRRGRLGRLEKVQNGEQLAIISVSACYNSLELNNTVRQRYFESSKSTDTGTRAQQFSSFGILVWNKPDAFLLSSRDPSELVPIVSKVSGSRNVRQQDKTSETQLTKPLQTPAEISAGFSCIWF